MAPKSLLSIKEPLLCIFVHFIETLNVSFIFVVALFRKTKLPKFRLRSYRTILCSGLITGTLFGIKVTMMLSHVSWLLGRSSFSSWVVSERIQVRDQELRIRWMVQQFRHFTCDLCPHHPRVLQGSITSVYLFTSFFYYGRVGIYFPLERKQRQVW